MPDIEPSASPSPAAAPAPAKVTAAAPAPAPAPVEADPTETLDEFCQRLSTTDNRVELIGAFHAMERRALRAKDSAANFSARFTAFINKPV